MNLDSNATDGFTTLELRLTRSFSGKGISLEPHEIERKDRQLNRAKYVQRLRRVNGINRITRKGIRRVLL